MIVFLEIANSDLRFAKLEVSFLPLQQDSPYAPHASHQFTIHPSLTSSENPDILVTVYRSCKSHNCLR